MAARVLSITSSTRSSGRRPQKTSVMCRFSAGTSRTSSAPPSASSTHVASALAASAGSVYAMKMRGRLTLASGPGHCSLRRYWWTKAMAMLPSPTAAATRLTGLKRTSPAGEDARHARLQQVRVAVVGPAPARGDVGARQHEAALVERDLGRQPGRVRVGADEDEQAAARAADLRPGGAIADVDRLELDVAVHASRPPHRAGSRCSTCAGPGPRGTGTCSSRARRRGR